MRNRRRFSLKYRLAVSLFVVSAIGIALAAYFAYREVYATDEAIAERTLQGQAKEFLDSLSFDPTTGAARLALSTDWMDAYSQPGGAFSYTLYDAGGNVQALSPNLKTPLPSSEVPAGEDYGSLEFRGPDAQMVMAAQAPKGGMLVVARKQVNSEALAESMLEESVEPMYILIPSGLVALATIWLVGGWSLRPLERASREASEVGPANPTARVSTDGLPSEVLPLVAAVNGALNRLSQAYEAERRLTADAAHELRTPLAVLDLRLQRAQLEGGIDWAAVRRDFEHLHRVMAQLLDLARMESAIHALPEPQPVNLPRIVREATAMVLPLADDAGREIEFATDAEVPISIMGHAADLRNMVRNLLDNALSHGQGKITVRLMKAARTDGDDPVVLQVQDEGNGIPEDLCETVFDRFRKGKASSTGAGLGLAIVRHVARAHGGLARVDPARRNCIEVVLNGAARRSSGQTA
ncbi:MAG TPA: HAMP domain-containing sensor histidine kinase [Dongiaceae bacterium]|nr:HAMP domain-containing sensor histidine kinase [Dongiaceae bacterium]